MSRYQKGGLKVPMGSKGGQQGPRGQKRKAEWKQFFGDFPIRELIWTHFLLQREPGRENNVAVACSDLRAPQNKTSANFVL